METITEKQIMKKIMPSKTQLILNALNNGEKLSGRDIWLRWKVYRASSVINRLRKRGYKIITRIEKMPDGTEFGIYFMAAA